MSLIARRGRVSGLASAARGQRALSEPRLLQRHLLACAQEHTWPTLRRRRFDFAHNARRLLETVAVLLPNSRAEADENRCPVRHLPPVVVVPNAADTETFHPRRRADERAGVLCVGRIEPRKNQLTLLNALRGDGDTAEAGWSARAL